MKSLVANSPGQLGEARAKIMQEDSKEEQFSLGDLCVGPVQNGINFCQWSHSSKNMDRLIVVVIRKYSRPITFAVSVGHGDDIFLLPAQEQQPGFAVQNS